VEEKKEDSKKVFSELVLKTSIKFLIKLIVTAEFLYETEKSKENFEAFYFYCIVLLQKLTLIKEYGENPTKQQLKEFQSKLARMKMVVNLYKQSKNN